MIGASKLRPQPSASPGNTGRLGQQTRRTRAILCLGFKKFSRIEGAQWAGAFSFNAFFSLFPVILILVTISSFFVDRETAGKAVIAHIESYLPISDERNRPAAPYGVATASGS